MGEIREHHLQRSVLGRLGAAAERLAGLPVPPGRRPPPELAPAPTRIDPAALAAELDRIAELRALHLPLGFWSEVDAAGLPRLHELFGLLELADRLRALGLPADLFDGVPEATVDCWRHRALAGLPATTARLPLLAALCRQRQRELAGELLELLRGLIDQLRLRVGERLQRQPAPSRERVLLRLVDSAAHGRIERAAPDLRAVLREADELTAAARGRSVRAAVRATFTPDHRQVAGALLGALELRGTERAWPLLAALGELVGGPAQAWEAGRHHPAGRIPLLGVVPERWCELVTDRRGRVDRVTYELCALVGLRESLDRGEITVPAAPG